MRVHVLFFAAYRERVGTGELHLELPDGSTVNDLLLAIWEMGEPYVYLPAAPVVAVNRRFAAPDTELRDGDEIAFVPPVAGG